MKKIIGQFLLVLLISSTTAQAFDKASFGSVRTNSRVEARFESFINDFNSSNGKFFDKVESQIHKRYKSKKDQQYISSLKAEFISEKKNIQLNQIKDGIAISYMNDKKFKLTNITSDSLLINDQLIQFKSTDNLHTISSKISNELMKVFNGADHVHSTIDIILEHIFIGKAHALALQIALILAAIIILPIFLIEYLSELVFSDLGKLVNACEAKDINTPYENSNVKKMYDEFNEFWSVDYIGKSKGLSCLDSYAKILGEDSYFGRVELDDICKKSKLINECIHDYKKVSNSTENLGRGIDTKDEFYHKKNTSKKVKATKH